MRENINQKLPCIKKIKIFAKKIADIELFLKESSKFRHVQEIEIYFKNFNKYMPIFEDGCVNLFPEMMLNVKKITIFCNYSCDASAFKKYISSAYISYPVYVRSYYI